MSNVQKFSLGDLFTKWSESFTRPIVVQFLYRKADGQEGIYRGTIDAKNANCIVDTIKSRKESPRDGEIYFTLIRASVVGYSPKRPTTKFSGKGILSDFTIVQ